MPERSFLERLSFSSRKIAVNDSTVSQFGCWIEHLCLFLRAMASHSGTISGVCGLNGPKSPQIKCSFLCLNLGTTVTRTSSA